MNAATVSQEHQRARFKSLRRERLRISNACQQCRSEKTKCDGIHPVCTRCREKAQKCSFGHDSNGTAINHGDHKSSKIRIDSITSDNKLAGAAEDLQLFKNTRASLASNFQKPVALSRRQSLEHLTQTYDLDQHTEPAFEKDRSHYIAHGPFASEIAAAITARAGVASPINPTNQVPFVDAPLFGAIDLEELPDTSSTASSSFLPESHLPPRAYADRLVGIYWRHVHPIESVLDREEFFRNYDVLYHTCREGLHHPSHAIWLSILYVVFAVAIQSQEAISRQRRDEEARSYFQLAWKILRPEAILWKPGSVELVQCLMMINRYLHCTQHQHQTWMTAGMAMRVAQSIGCHLAESSSGSATDKEKELKVRVWVSCVALDRCVNWVLGKSSAPSLIPMHGNSRADASLSTGRHIDDLMRDLDLHEIGNQIQLAQIGAWGQLGPRLGLSELYKQHEYHTMAVQLDECLNKWEQNLPDDWNLRNLQCSMDGTSRAARYLTHLRLSHMRIILYRPMLARFCLSNSTATQADAENKQRSATVSDRLIREYAAMCIEVAQRLTALVVETLEPDSAMGVLPWWYRIYYLHVAGVNFLAAMFTSDLFTESVSMSWDTVMSALQAHNHLSAYVPQCIHTFETLSTKALQSRHHNLDDAGYVGNKLPPENFLIDTLFQDINFDFDSLIYDNKEVPF